MKRIFLLFLILCLKLNSQENSTENDSLQKRITSKFVELFAFPPFIQTIGIGVTDNKKSEHLITASTVIFPLFTAGIRYNYNYSIFRRGKKNLYIPFWFGLKRLAFYFGSNVSQSLSRDFISLGSGIGLKINLENNTILRLELGLGAALNFEIHDHLVTYDAQTFYINGLDRYKLDKSNPIVPSLKMNLRFLIPLNK